MINAADIISLKYNENFVNQLVSILSLLLEMDAAALLFHVFFTS